MKDKLIGKYYIEELIGEGTTSKIYSGRDQFSNEKVAIKIARQHIFKDLENGEQFRKMFMTEAGLAGKLQHPHIVKVMDAGVDNDVHYIVMELIKGRSLRPFCKSNNLLKFSEIAEIIYKCCDALNFALKQGVIHRDIKPANIMVQDVLKSNTFIKLADFGAAFRLDVDETQITDMVGSPAYMAPEVLRGADVSHHADIYALGVVMYQALTANLPYTPKKVSVLIQSILNDKPTPITHYRTDIPSALQYIIKRATAPDVNKRYQDWISFANDLATVQDELDTQETQTSDIAKFNQLKRLSLFETFNDAELWELLKISQWRTFPPNTILIKEGRKGRSLYVLVSGEAKVVRKQMMLGLVEVGESFGEISFITSMPRTASIITTKQSVVIKLDAAMVEKSSERIQMLISNTLLKLLAKRLEVTSAMVSSTN